MEKHPKQTTMNGAEIKNPGEVLSAEGLKNLVVEVGVDGSTPKERADQFKNVSLEDFTGLIDNINRGVQGSADSLILEDGVMKIGDKETIPVEYRYEVMSELMRLIKESSDDVNPERLGIVLLHPFQDGNGRTARIAGSIFHEEYDDGWENNYGIVSESRDIARERGGFIINGYIPYLPEGKSRSNPEDVIAYLESLLSSEHKDDRLYTGPFGQAPLYK